MKTNRKVKVYKVGHYWYAHMPTGGEGFDIETMVVAMGDTPEQAYNEWERLVGRRKERNKEEMYTWLWIVAPSLIAGVLVWIFG